MTYHKKQIRRFLIFLFILTLALLKGGASFAQTNSDPLLIRIAILDNFTAEKSSQKYKNAYFAGIDTAVFAAKKKKIRLEYKVFSYGNNPLNVLGSIADVQKWNPDFIIGPHSSNQFLLLKKYFKKILVISPYATDEEITKMPSNFYSLPLSDSYMAKANLLFIEKYFPHKNIFNITKADCKDCVDMTTIFNKIYKEKYPQALINDSYYIENNVKKLNLPKLMSNYKPGSAIILQPLSYSDAQILIQNISHFLQEKNLVFIFNLDNWGDSNETKKDNLSKYSVFRISPILQDRQSVNFKNYLKDYKSLFNTLPTKAVSYMTYSSVMSVVKATTFPSKEKISDLRKTILDSYIDIHQKNPYWYRPTAYMIYGLSQKGEVAQKIIVDFNKDPLHS